MSQIVNDRPPVTYHKKTFFQRLALDFRQNKMVYLMWLPVLAFYLIFHYAPMGGLVIAFQNYKPFKGIAKSKFVGLEHFQEFLTGPYAWRTIRNTLVISLLQILIGFPMPIIFALLINEVRCNPYKRVVQTVSYMPHFISLVVMCGMIVLFLSPSSGIIPKLLGYIGVQTGDLMGKASAFSSIYVWTEAWQHVGWDSIMYIAALSAVDPQLYEVVDGANKWQKMRSIDIPLLMPTAVVLFILRAGSVMSVGFEKVYLLQNDLNISASEIISTYVYKMGLKSNQYSYSAAIGLFNNVVNFILLLSVNFIAGKMGDTSLF